MSHFRWGLPVEFPMNEAIAGGVLRSDDDDNSLDHSTRLEFENFSFTP